MSEPATREWLELLATSDIPHTAAIAFESLFDDAHLRAVGFFPELDHPSEGRVRTTAVPSRSFMERGCIGGGSGGTTVDVTIGGSGVDGAAIGGIVGSANALGVDVVGGGGFGAVATGGDCSTLDGSGCGAFVTDGTFTSEGRAGVGVGGSTLTTLAGNGGMTASGCSGGDVAGG